jgi:hypothetical protein
LFSVGTTPVNIVFEHIVLPLTIWAVFGNLPFSVATNRSSDFAPPEEEERNTENDGEKGCASHRTNVVTSIQFSTPLHSSSRCHLSPDHDKTKETKTSYSGSLAKVPNREFNQGGEEIGASCSRRTIPTRWPIMAQEILVIAQVQFHQTDNNFSVQKQYGETRSLYSQGRAVTGNFRDLPHSKFQEGRSEIGDLRHLPDSIFLNLKVVSPFNP